MKLTVSTLIVAISLDTNAGVSSTAVNLRVLHDADAPPDPVWGLVTGDVIVTSLSPDLYHQLLPLARERRPIRLTLEEL